MDNCTLYLHYYCTVHLLYLILVLEKVSGKQLTFMYSAKHRAVNRPYGRLKGQSFEFQDLSWQGRLKRQSLESQDLKFTIKGKETVS